jgi:hypothetical protein
MDVEGMKPVHFVLVASMLASLTGCGRHGATGYALFATGVVVGAAVATEHEHEEARERAREEREDDYPYTRVIIVNPPVVVTTVPAASPPAAPSSPPFDAKRARASLAEVDVSSCREAGAPRGYGHARVTFNPSGDTTKVVVDEPSAMPPAAARCVGEALGRATVPEFHGSLVTVGTTWFVP